MALLPNFKLGFKTYSEAHRLIIRHRLWGYVILPAIINTVLLLFLIFFGWYYIGLFTDWIMDVSGLNSSPTGFLKYLVIFLKWLARIGIYILLFLLYFSVFRYIVLALISPALAILSEKTDKILTGINYPFRFKQFLKDVFRGIMIVLRNLFIETGLLILCFFLGFIPVVGWLASIFMFFVTCYFYGFSMIDYSNERSKISIRESVKFIRKNRGMAIANGMVFYFFFFFVPVVGFVFAPAYSVIAATIAVHKLRNDVKITNS